MNFNGYLLYRRVISFKELTVSAHYQYETASMVGVSIRDAKRVDVDLNEITRRYSK